MIGIILGKAYTNRTEDIDVNVAYRMVSSLMQLCDGDHNSPRSPGCNSSCIFFILDGILLLLVRGGVLAPILARPRLLNRGWQRAVHHQCAFWESRRHGDPRLGELVDVAEVETALDGLVDDEAAVSQMPCGQHRRCLRVAKGRTWRRQTWLRSQRMERDMNDA